MSYYDEIDPIGEGKDENNCGYCGDPCDGSYCNDNCKRADLY